MNFNIKFKLQIKVKVIKLFWNCSQSDLMMKIRTDQFIE